MTNGPDTEGFLTLFRETADALARLLEGHLRLARLELIEGASRIARHARMAAVFAVLAIIGYALLMLGLTAWLEPSLGWPVSLAMIGGVHLVGGGLGTWLALRGLGTPALMPRTAHASAQSLAAFHAPEHPRVHLKEQRAS